jgi:uncharacterized phage protein gp47/JayE
MTTLPTIIQLRNTLITNFQNEFGVTIPTWGKNFLRVLAAVLGGALWVVYKTIGYVQKNVFVDTCDWVTLLRFGLARLGRHPFPARQGQYEVEVTGNIGATIPANTTFKADDTSQSPGKLYILDVAYVLTSTTDTITLRALEAGLDSQLALTNTLTATAPIAGVNPGAEVTAESVAPQAAEEIEEYRLKVIQSFRLEPQGGAGADYRSWGQDAQGVKQIYPYTSAGANEVDIFVEATIMDSTDGKGTPTPTILTDVEACIEEDPDTTVDPDDRGRRPIGVFAVNVQAITPLDVDITILNYQDLTPAKQTIIDAALGELIQSIRPFVASTDVLADRNDVLNHSKIITAVSIAVPGSIFSGVSMTVASIPVTTYLFDLGSIPHLNSVSYV